MAIEKRGRRTKGVAKRARPAKSSKARHSHSRSRTDGRIKPTGSVHLSSGTTVKSRIRAIGNSKGVIINNQLLKDAGIDSDADIISYADQGKIIIMQAEASEVNTDLSTWDQQFKAAKRNGAKPEGDLFSGLSNEFDTKEW